MTKPEELARKISNDADLLGSAGCSRIQAQLETALKPLLDAAEELDKAFTSSVPDAISQTEYDTGLRRINVALGNFREQLSQWRKK